MTAGANNDELELVTDCGDNISPDPVEQLLLVHDLQDGEEVPNLWMVV